MAAAVPDFVLGHNEPMTDSNPELSPSRQPLWTSKLFLLAALSLIVGTGLWIRDALTAVPATPVAEGSPPSGPNPSGSSLVDNPSPADAPPVSLTDGAPLTFRMGAGFMGGFVVAWAFRKFIRLALLISAIAVGTIALAKTTGLVDIDWSGVERTVTDGVGQATARAGEAKDALLRYVPGGLCSFVGLFVGARRA